MPIDETRIGTKVQPVAPGEGPERDRRRRSRARVTVLTILCHPDVERVGEVATLGELLAGRGVSLSRHAPLFVSPTGGERRPLADPFLSRTPMRLLPAQQEAGLLLVLGECRTPVTVDGQPIEEARDLPAAVIERGAVIELANRVVLLLHTLPQESYAEPDGFGLIGHSEGISRVRQEIRRVADLEVPVLLRGETGTGKELAARGIHAASRRAAEVCLSVNLGAIPPGLAAAELFGFVKGAFTGAVRNQMGYFQRAHGGTLFLDELGEAPADLQVMLLRALETGEVQRVGGQDPVAVDVRLVAATDLDLDEAIEAGRFRAPLLHRLSGYEIDLPPLRERRDDIGRLLYCFLVRELRETGEEERLATRGDVHEPWLPASVVARLARYDWPGNVRQLRNVVRQLVIASRGAEQVEIPQQVERLLREASEPAAAAAPAPPASGGPAIAEASEPPRRRAPARSYRKPSEVSEQELIAALRANRFRIKPAAAELGVSRSSLYELIDRCSRLRRAGDLGRRELAACHAACGGDLEAMVERLEISKHALRQRLRELGIS